jgi:CheY-like chemotaxis protein
MQTSEYRVRRILVVDDNLDYVDSMALILRGLGHLVYFAINGIAALEEARRFRPEFIFLDVGLPDGDGRLLARQLRRQAGLEAVRIMCVTGRRNEDPGKSLAAGCDDHYLKPLDPALLGKLLQS